VYSISACTDGQSLIEYTSYSLTAPKRLVFSVPAPVARDKVDHMKTTIDIADALLEPARQAAAADGITLRELVEQALRRALVDRKRRASFRLRQASFRGRGLQPGVAEGSWECLRDLIYEGRGA
jgi:Arc/MetJ family transcription regulator